MFNFLLLSGSFYYLVQHGIDYVAWPRLQPLTDTINYSGKGFFSGKHGRGFAAGGGGKIGGKHKRLEVKETGDKDMEMAHQTTAASAPGKKRLD